MGSATERATRSCGSRRRATRARILVLLAPTVALGVFARERLGTGSAPPFSPLPAVVVTAEQLARSRRAWTEERGRNPDPVEERQIAADAIDDAILSREALALGLGRSDRSVRSRLVELGGLLGLAAEGDAPRLELGARSLGLERSDPIISVHLADLLRLALAKTGSSDVPDEAELARYYERNAARFAQPARLRFAHVYLARDRHRAAAVDPIRLLDELRARAVAPRDAAAMGDPFVHGDEIGPLPTSDIARLLGPAFAAALDAAPERQWVGPVPSPYGLHLVWVEQRIAGRVPPLESVRNRVVHAVLRERGEERLRERLNGLRSRYPAEIDSPDLN